MQLNEQLKQIQKAEKNTIIDILMKKHQKAVI